MEFRFALANFCKLRVIVVTWWSCMKRSYNCQIMLIFAWKYLVFAPNAVPFVVSRVFVAWFWNTLPNHGSMNAFLYCPGYQASFSNTSLQNFFIIFLCNCRIHIVLTTLRIGSLLGWNWTVFKYTMPFSIAESAIFQNYVALCNNAGKFVLL